MQNNGISPHIVPQLTHIGVLPSCQDRISSPEDERKGIVGVLIPATQEEASCKNGAWQSFCTRLEILQRGGEGLVTRWRCLWACRWF